MALFFDQSTTTAVLVHRPAGDVPPPRDSTGASCSRATATASAAAVDREQFGMGWNQLGMIRGLTTVAGTLRFTRRAAA